MLRIPIGKLIGVLLFVPSIACAQDYPDLALPTEPNHANVQLESNVDHLAVSVGQGAPLPPGGCIAGYAWHSTYGGCRKASIETQTAACPSGTIGNRTRTRQAFALQANSANVSYSSWIAWNDSKCIPDDCKNTITIQSASLSVDGWYPEERRPTSPGSLKVTSAGSGTYNVDAGYLVSDSNWNGWGKTLSSFVFKIDRLASIKKFVLTRAYIDDWLLVYVNGNVIFQSQGPMGASWGSEEVYGLGPYSSLSINAKPYLVQGTNKIELRAAVFAWGKAGARFQCE